MHVVNRSHSPANLMTNTIVATVQAQLHETNRTHAAHEYEWVAAYGRDPQCLQEAARANRILSGMRKEVWRQTSRVRRAVQTGSVVAFLRGRRRSGGFAGLLFCLVSCLLVSGRLLSSLCESEGEAARGAPDLASGGRAGAGLLHFKAASVSSEVGHELSQCSGGWSKVIAHLHSDAEAFAFKCCRVVDGDWSWSLFTACSRACSSISSCTSRRCGT